MFDWAQFLGLEVTLEDGRTLSLGISGDAVGAYFPVDRERRGEREPTPVDLSTGLPRWTEPLACASRSVRQRQLDA